MRIDSGDDYRVAPGRISNRSSVEVIAVNTTLRVNGTNHELSNDTRLSLLDALRDVLGLTGTKKGPAAEPEPLATEPDFFD